MSVQRILGQTDRTANLPSQTPTGDRKGVEVKTSPDPDRFFQALPPQRTTDAAAGRFRNRKMGKGA